MSADLALVQTVDFFAPIVDDPYEFGQVAAANALSDVYAMGGEPLTALSIVGFPSGKLPLSVLTEILRGGQDKVHEAGATIIGGHSIIDDELKYGLSVTGSVHPDRILANNGAIPGDVLVLTKALGTGFVTTALKRGVIDPATGQVVEGDIVPQARRVLENLEAVLAAAGASWKNVVKTTVFLQDMADFPRLNEVYAAAMGDARPARSTVQVAALPRGVRVEIELVAHLG